MSYLLDNGAYSLKFGLKGGSPCESQNCMGRHKRDILISPSTLDNLSEILRPFDRGVLIDSDLQSRIWSSLFSDHSISSLVYTCPLYTPPSSRRLLDELVYEDFNIPQALRVPFGGYPTSLLVDLGFSSSLVTPIYQGLPLSYAVRRVIVGGKLLTNFMKEQISYRFFDMTEETWLVNHIREQMCSVSSNFLCELRALQ